MHDKRKINVVRHTPRALWARGVQLLAPISKDEDNKRQELVLNVILLISIPFLAFADFLIGRNTLRMGTHYHGVPFWISSLVVTAFIFLFFASKRGYHRPVSYILIALYTLCTVYCGWHWGASLPATLLSIALVSVISSLLIGSRFGFIMSTSLIIGLSFLAIHEIKTLGILSWKYQTINQHDVFIYSAILFFISAISWLSNREIEKSLRRARASEKSLAEERDSLEVKVIERTEELRATQEQRIAELSQSAEFGKISQGLFHDLMTPLTSVALHMETLRDVSVPEIQNTRAYLEKAMRASERMGVFMHTIRRGMESNSPIATSSPDADQPVSLNHELTAAIELLNFKARKMHVDIINKMDEALTCTGNPIHFFQIFLNLISNAIDALETVCGEKKITVTAYEIEGVNGTRNIYISVADNGIGIPENNRIRIFDDFFSTKKQSRGTGIGLSTVKKLVTKKLGGTIDVDSAVGNGTVFTILFPKR